MASRATAKTELFAQWQQGALVVADQGNATGNRFWVDGNTGSDSSGYGRSPDMPFDTLAYAFSSDSVTANNGDIVYLMEGHTESVQAAADMVLDIAGVRIVGLGTGATRPTITFDTATTADIDITAADITIENVLFYNDLDSMDIPLDLSGDDFHLINCEFRDAAANKEANIWMDASSAADRLVVIGLKYNGLIAGDACTDVIRLNGGTGAYFKDCNFYGEVSTGMINMQANSYDVVVENCYFYNDNVALTKDVVDTGGSSTWAARDCYDGKGGYGFSGGSGASGTASDDVSTIAALIGSSAGSTQTSDLHGKFGTDTEMGDRSLYDLLVGDGPVTAPSSAAPASDVSLYEVASAVYDDTAVIGAATATESDTVCGKIGTDAELGDRSLYDLLAGDGPVTAPSSAAPANDVSLYEVASAIYDDTALIGAAEATESDTVCGKIGTDTELGDRSLYDLLVGDGPVTAPSSAAPASDVSLYEVASAVYDDTNVIGAAEATESDSVCGKIGTDTEMYDRSLYDLLVGDGPATAPSAAAAASDVSLYEVVRYLSENQLPRSLVTTITDMNSADYTTNATTVIFTVTGDVLARAWGVVGTSITSNGNNATISLGTSDNYASLIPAATADGTEMVAGDVWFDATSGSNSGALPDDGSWVAIGGGADISTQVLTSYMTAGGMKVYLQWMPASSDGAVTAAF